MNWSEIALAIVSAIATGIGGWWAFIGKRAQSADQQRTEFYAQIMAECQSQRALIVNLNKQVTSLQNEVHLLREKLEFYEENPATQQSRQLLESIFSSPALGPAWIHDLGNNRWYLNDQYCNQFNVIRKGGFWTPVNILGRYKADDALSYVKNDMEVIETNATIEFTETAKRRIMDPNCSETFTAKYRKHPIRLGDDLFVFGQLLEEL